MSTYALPATITFSRSLPSPPSPPTSSPPLSQSPVSPHSSPPSNQLQSGLIASPSGGGVRMSAAKPMTAAERKRKNADAQAAFRQRRNEYIKKLEAAVEDREAMIKNLKDEKTGMARESQGLRDENTRLQGKIEVFQATMKENDKLVKMLEKQLQAAQTQQQQQAHAQQQSSQSLGFEYGGLYAAPTGILYANQAPNSSFSGMPSLTMPIHNMSADFASNANGPSPPRGPHHISASTFGTPTTGMRITTIAPSVAEQAQASQSFHAYTDNGSRFEVNNHASGSAGISSDSASSEANGGTGMTNSPIEAAATVQTMPPGTDGISSQSTGANQYSFPTAQQHHQQAQNQGMSYPSSDYPYAHSTYSQPSQRLQSEHQQDIKPPTPAQPFRSAQAINSLNNMNLDPAMSETVALLKAQAFGKARRRRNLSGYDESSTTSATALDIRKRPRFEDDDV